MVVDATASLLIAARLRGVATFYDLPGIPDGSGAGGSGRGQNANPVEGSVRDVHLSGGVHSHVVWVSQLGVTGWAIISGEAHNSISRYCGDHSVRDLADARIVPVRDEEVSKWIDGDA